MSEYQPRTSIPEDVIFHLETSQSTRVRPSLEALSHTIVDGKVVFDSTGMRASNYDNTQCNLLDFFIESNLVEYYACKRDMELWISFDRLAKSTRDFGEEDIMCFQMTETSYANSELRVIQIAPKFSQVHKISLRMPPLDPFNFHLGPITFLSAVDFETALLQRFLRTHEKNSDRARFASYNGEDNLMQYFMMHSKGDEDEISTVVPCEFNGTPSFYLQGHEMKAKGVDSPRGDLFSLRFLNLCAKATGSGKFCKIYLGEGKPLVIRYPIGTIGSLTCFIAGADPEESRERITELTMADKEEVKRREQIVKEQNDLTAVTTKRKLDESDKGVFKRRKLESEVPSSPKRKRDDEEIPVPKRRKAALATVA